MIIVLSAPEFIPDEIKRIHQLFDLGLGIFHLRKPNASMAKLRSFIQRIKPEFHDRVALHHHHELAEEFGINRLHFPEEHRKKTISFTRSDLQNKILSTSIHARDHYYELPDSFNYTFLGPVFDSISKENYTAMKHSDRWVDRKGLQTKLIGIGGINSENAREALHYGFDGIALLGAVWNYSNGIEEFKRICTKCPMIAQ